MVQIPKSSVPKDFICPITNEIMEDPVFDPMFDAVSFERKAVLRRLKEKGQAYCPVSGYPLTAEALVSNTKLQWMIRFWLKQQAKTSGATTDAEAARDEDTAATTATAEDDIAATTTAANKDIPKHLICPLSGAIMKDPVTTKHGYNFEKVNLVNWLCKNGNICPLTYQPLEMRQVVPNVKLQMELRRYHLNQQGEDVTVTVVPLQTPPIVAIDKVNSTGKNFANSFGKMNVFKAALQSFKIRNGTTLSLNNPIAASSSSVVEESEVDVMARVESTLEDVEKLLLIAD